jgi:hypothetical protein
MRLEQPTHNTAAPAEPPTLSEAVEPQPPPTEQPQSEEQVSAQRPALWLDDTGIAIVRATRSWVQYGTVGFAVICILIGAVEGLFGR